MAQALPWLSLLSCMCLDVARLRGSLFQSLFLSPCRPPGEEEGRADPLSAQCGARSLREGRFCLECRCVPDRAEEAGETDGDPPAFFLAWTTTPWTLPANLALCVNPDLTYVQIRNKQTNV